MAGKKGMKQYGSTIIEEVLAMREAGKTNKEIGEYFNLTGHQPVHDLLKRYRKKQQLLMAGVMPRRKGRPPQGYVSITSETANVIKQLQMENELLRSFLQIAGRK